MEYLTVKEAAEKWQLNIRTVQKWAKEGKLEGALKMGRDWMIPAEAVNPGIPEKPADLKPVNVSQQTKRFVVPAMPVMSGKFPPGKALEYISNLPTEELRKLATAEWHYFRGECVRAAYITEELRNSKDYNLRVSALLVHGFANIQLRRIAAVRQDFQRIAQETNGIETRQTEAERLFGYYVQIMCKVLLHDVQNLEKPFQKQIPELPDGLRFYGTYIIAHYYYLKQEYHRSLGIAETSLILFGNDYPVGTIYLFLVIAMNLISLREKEKAEIYFRKAWEIAKKDGFLEPFGEHHGLLGGLVEKCLKDTEPEAYEMIIQMVYDFSEGWRQIHNPATEEQVTSDLTTLEFSIAMLASKGWSNKEIGRQLNLSENMVKNITKAIYQKLGVSGRKELKPYMLR